MSDVHWVSVFDHEGVEITEWFACDATDRVRIIIQGGYEQWDSVARVEVDGQPVDLGSDGLTPDRDTSQPWSQLVINVGDDDADELAPAVAPAPSESAR